MKFKQKIPLGLPRVFLFGKLENLRFSKIKEAYPGGTKWSGRLAAE
jgi:hypothetical protein